MSQYQQPPSTGVESSTQQASTVGQSGGASTVGSQQGAGVGGAFQGTGQQQMGQQFGSQQAGQKGVGQQQSLEFPTSSDVPPNIRTQIIQQLNQTLADTTVLLTHARFAHWNVKGMAFYGLHDLFEEIAETFEEHVDLIAERITALGGQAQGTAGMAVGNCRLPAMPTNVITGREFIQVLAERIAIHDANLTQTVLTATEWNDVDTADLLNEISREVSEALWFLEAHIQTQPVTGGGQQVGGGAQASSQQVGQQVGQQGQAGQQVPVQQGQQSGVGAGQAQQVPRTQSQ